jgi:hypothetical protein
MSAAGSRHTSSTVHDGVLVVTVQVPRLREPGLSYIVRDEVLEALAAAGAQHLVLDLRQIESIGSVGLLAFIALRRHLPDGEIVLCQLAAEVRQIFQACRLIPAGNGSPPAGSSAPFRAADTREDAIALIRGL